MKNPKSQYGEYIMRTYIVYLLLITLLAHIVSVSIAQQDQNVPKTDSEADKLKIQLQTVENEKMEVERKLAEANARLINTDIDKLKGELRESNNDWLRVWSLWFTGIIGFFVVILLGVSAVFWYWLRSRADKLIENEVGKSLKGFQEAVEKVNILEDQLRILRKEQAASKIEASFQPDFGSGLGLPKENEARREEALKEILEEALLDVFEDKKYHLGVRHKAAELLVQKSPPIIVPLFDLLNSAIDPDSDIISKIGKRPLRESIAILSGIENLEVYDGLTKYLKRLLLLENTELKDSFLTWTVFSLTYIGIALDTDSSISLMKKAIPYLEIRWIETQNIIDLARYFDKFDEPEGIKDILKYLGSTSSDVEEICLDLLQKYDPDFVSEWKEKKENTNTERENT